MAFLEIRPNEKVSTRERRHGYHVRSLNLRNFRAEQRNATEYIHAKGWNRCDWIVDHWRAFDGLRRVGGCEVR